MTLSKTNGIIITAVTAVLFGCAAVFSCLTVLLSVIAQTGELFQLFEPIRYLDIAGTLCTGLAFISLPVIFYVIFVHGRNEGEPEADTAKKPAAAPKKEKKASTPKPKTVSPAKTIIEEDPGDKKDDDGPPDVMKTLALDD